MAETSESISYPGQVDILNAEIVNSSGKIIDITALMGELSLYEDLFSNTMSGSLVIEDALDLIANLPMIGQETFNVEIRTPTLNRTIKKSFYIYKIHGRVGKPRSQIYMINFCSHELIRSSNVKISQSFSGNISDTVAKIFTDGRMMNSKSGLFVDATKNSYQFIAPYWSPMQTINWLAQRSVNKSGAANYLFYETNQSFEFVSMDLLVQQAPEREYIYGDTDPNTFAGADGDRDAKYKIVESVDTGSSFDYLRQLNSGMLSSRLWTLDLTTRTMETRDWDYVRDFSKNKHLDVVPMKTDSLIRNPMASIKWITKNNHQTGASLDQGYADSWLQRGSQIEQLQQFKLRIKVAGRTDVKVGNVIKFRMPQGRQILGDEIETTGDSEYYTGRYLITAIRHQIISGDHRMEMEIVRDSFVRPLKSTVGS